MGFEGFKAMDNPISSVKFNADTEDLSTLGSNVSKQFKKGIKEKKVLIPNTNYGVNKLNKE